MADDRGISAALSRLLEHYFDLASDLPADIRLILHLNRWANVPAACETLA